MMSAPMPRRCSRQQVCRRGLVYRKTVRDLPKCLATAPERVRTVLRLLGTIPVTVEKDGSVVETLRFSKEKLLPFARCPEQNCVGSGGALATDFCRQVAVA
jgi:hypothetical protein